MGSLRSPENRGKFSFGIEVFAAVFQKDKLVAQAFGPGLEQIV
jgi:hypothetical protein